MTEPLTNAPEAPASTQSPTHAPAVIVYLPAIAEIPGDSGFTGLVERFSVALDVMPRSKALSFVSVPIVASEAAGLTYVFRLRCSHPGLFQALTAVPPSANSRQPGH